MASTTSLTHAVCAVTSSSESASPSAPSMRTRTHGALVAPSELNVNDVDAVLGRELLELVDDELLLLALDHATPPQ